MYTMDFEEFLYAKKRDDLICEIYKAYNNKITLNYWKNDNTAEIDYIIDTDESIIPIEVKSGSNLKSKRLDIYIKKYNPKYAIKLSTRNFKFNKTVYNIPIYASFVIKG